jgi:hypothetical protein
MNTTQTQQSPEPEAIFEIEFLTTEGEDLQLKLIDVMKSKQARADSVIKLLQGYEQDVVQRVLPTVMGRFIDEKSKNEKKAEAMRTAVLELETKHNFSFKWNRLYKSFVQGLAVETFDPKSRTTQEHIDYVKSVFGSNYESDLGLSPEKADSKRRELVPLGKSVEKLNLDLGLFKQLLHQIRDSRTKALEGVQGVRKDVTIGDLCQLKKALEDLVWTSTPRVRNRAVTEALAAAHRTSQKRATQSKSIFKIPI